MLQFYVGRRKPANVTGSGDIVLGAMAVAAPTSFGLLFAGTGSVALAAMAVEGVGSVTGFSDDLARDRQDRGRNIRARTRR